MSERPQPPALPTTVAELLARRKFKRSKRVAYHEIGHAVVCHVMGGQFDRVVIQAGSIGGYLKREGHSLLYPLFKEVVVLLAGPIAEARYRRCSPSVTYLEQVGGDITKAQSWVDQLAVRDGVFASDIFQQAENYAVALVRENWRDIVRVADVLLLYDLSYLEFLYVLNN